MNEVIDIGVNSLNSKKKEFLSVLEKYQGNVSNACISFGISRTTHYNWVNDDPWYKSQVEDIGESVIDFVENKLLSRINGITMATQTPEGETIIYTEKPSDACIIFYLKTRAKHRGYVEKNEVDFSSKGKELKTFTDPSANTVFAIEGLPKSMRGGVDIAK